MSSFPFSSSSPRQSSITFIFQNCEDRFAILKNGFGEIRWPMDKFPQNLRQGDKVNIKIINENDEENELYATRRRLLEELIN